MLSLGGFLVINNSTENNDLHAAPTICMKVDPNHLTLAGDFNVKLECVVLKEFWHIFECQSIITDKICFKYFPNPKCIKFNSIISTKTSSRFYCNWN